MLIIIARLGFFGIWITPFVFVVSFLEAINAIVNKEKYQSKMYTSAISFTLTIIFIYLLILYN